MEESSPQKKRIFYLVVLILTFITMIVAATLAYFKLVGSQEEEGTTLYTGTLAVNYIDGVYIRNPELWPINGVNFNTTKDVYRNRFSVSSYGTLSQTIGLELEVERNDFLEGEIQYTIYSSEGKELSSGVVPKEGKKTLSSNLYLESEDTATYTLIIWLKSTNYNQNFEMGETYITGKINIYAVQSKY